MATLPFPTMTSDSSQDPMFPVSAYASLYAKLARVFSKVHRVPKRGRNDFHKYDYATAADVLDAVRIPLADENVFIFAKTEEVTQVEWITPQGKPTQWKTTVTLSFTFCDGDTGATITTSFKGEGIDALDKGLPKAITAATKYFLQTNFLISTGDDPESDVKLDMIAEGAPKPSPAAQTTYGRNAKGAPRAQTAKTAPASSATHAKAAPVAEAPAPSAAPSTPPEPAASPSTTPELDRTQLGHLAALMKQKQITPDALMTGIKTQFGWMPDHPRHLTPDQYQHVIAWLQQTPEAPQTSAS